MTIKSKGLKALTVEAEQAEINVVGKREPVILRRTFNMTIEGTTLKFWRVLGPATHRNLNSDLSLAGLKQWGVIR